MTADREAMARSLRRVLCDGFGRIYARCRSVARTVEYHVPAPHSVQQALDQELVAAWVQQLEREWRGEGIGWTWTCTAYDSPQSGHHT